MKRKLSLRRMSFNVEINQIFEQFRDFSENQDGDSIIKINNVLDVSIGKFTRGKRFYDRDFEGENQISSYGEEFGCRCLSTLIPLLGTSRSSYFPRKN